MSGKSEKRIKKFFYKRLAGMVLISASIGMFLVLLIPSWAFFIAAILAVAGFYLLFFC